MAKKQQLIDKFLELRLQGKTYHQISQELGVSKTALIEWSKDEKISEKIEIERLARIQELTRKLQLYREARICRIGEMNNKMLEELEARDYSQVPTERLLQMVLKNLQYLESIIPPPKTFEDTNPFLSGLMTPPNKFTFDPMD